VGAGLKVTYVYDEPEIAQPAAEVSADPAQILTAFLLEDDQILAQTIALLLEPYGYQVKHFSAIGQLEQALNESVPDVILMDVELPDGESTEYVLNNLDRFKKINVPYVFMSSRDAFSYRLRAVRAGASGYFLKPVNISSLVDRLDKCTRREVRDPYRVLIVDDSLSIARFEQKILEDAGMHVSIVTDPDQMLPALDEHNPDLLLMDLYMPGCNGQELAGVIRQLDNYLGIPIVYLSSEANVDVQLTAMGVGGDDFLTKPIDPHRLVATVSNRVERSRKLRSLMVRDGLTGLLNHSAIKEKLEHEVDRAHRNASALVVGMVDIDKFKSVNDTYGHSTGDRVIKSLSRILQQRLRRTDAIGRYGGEEFAILLLDTDIENAERIMNQIREDFNKIAQQGGEGQVFFSSFSCGLVQIRDKLTAKDLYNAADAALYQAKEGGRNQVVVSK